VSSALASAPAEDRCITWLSAALARAIGIAPPQAAALLRGRLAVAASGWTISSDAILLAEPLNAVEFESALQLPHGSASGPRPVRAKLGQDHELAWDGRVAMVGRPKAPGLYTKTLALWGNEAGVSLSELADFSARRAALSPHPQVLAYVSAGPRRAGAGPLFTWPVSIESAAVGLETSPTGLEVETNLRLSGKADGLEPTNPPIHLLWQLPASTLAAWTQKIDYLANFKQLDAAFPRGPGRFYIDVLQVGLQGGVERNLLDHLVGDTLFMIGQAEQPVAAEQVPLLIPGLVMSVQVDDSYTVTAAMERITQNLLRMVNLESPPSSALGAEAEPIGPDGGTIHSVPIGKYIGLHPGGELLKWSHLSWTVADGSLVVGSDPGLVRSVVQARRGREPKLTAPPQQTHGGRPIRYPEMVLIAYPAAGGEMIASWIDYLSRNYPEVLQPGWWQELRQRRLPSKTVQLGIMSGSDGPYAVEVADMMPGNWPANQLLQAGDRIIAIDGQPLGPPEPQRSLRHLLSIRRRPDRVSLCVVRAGCEMDVELPMPASPPAAAPGPLQPLEVLARTSRLMRTFSTAQFTIWQQAPGTLSARLELRYAPAAR
jgi:hypothetical protein